MSVDQDGNFYVAEVNAGRVQKYIPRQGANPALLVGKHRLVRLEVMRFNPRICRSGLAAFLGFVLQRRCRPL